MTIRWFRGLAVAGATLMAATALAGTALAAGPPMPGIEVDDESGRCTAGFATQGNDDSYYLLTSGHCAAHDGSVWTYEQDVPLGKITASENDGDNKDAAIIRLDPSVGVPIGDVGGKYPVRDVLSPSQIQVGMPFCKLGAVSGETCGTVKSVEDGVVEASVYSLKGDSGGAGFVKNADGSVSAVGILMSSPEGDDHTTYFTLVYPLLGRWSLRILP